jgi:hypothetical protein
MAVRAVKVDCLFVCLDTEPLAQHEGEFMVELFCCASYRGYRQSKRISSTRFHSHFERGATVLTPARIGDLRPNEPGQK